MRGGQSFAICEAKWRCTRSCLLSLREFCLSVRQTLYHTARYTFQGNIHPYAKTYVHLFGRLPTQHRGVHVSPRNWGQVTRSSVRIIKQDDQPDWVRGHSQCAVVCRSLPRGLSCTLTHADAYRLWHVWNGLSGVDPVTHVAARIKWCILRTVVLLHWSVVHVSVATLVAHQYSCSLVLMIAILGVFFIYCYMLGIAFEL